MNFLAHLLLADDTPASRIGNLLGDFTRGPISDLAAVFPEEVLRGIVMHRAIDSFTDKHSNFAHARLLIVPERRRFAGITIDLFWDHFLSVHWQAYHQMPLPGFCQQVYRELEEHPQWHAGRMGEIVPLMKRQNWLMRYSSFEGMRTTLNEVSQRSRRIAPIADGIEDLTTYYEEHQRHFLAFMPELIAFVEAWKKKH